MGWFSRKKKLEVPAPPSEDILKFPKPEQTEKIIQPKKDIEPSPPPEKEGPSLPPQEKLPPPTEKELPPPKEKGFFSFKKPKPTPLPPMSDKIKQAVGLDQPMEKPLFPETPHPLPPTHPLAPKPHFLRVTHYQTLLENLDTIRKNNLILNKNMEDLAESQFNEEKTYQTLKNKLKKVHDSLLDMDELIFKHR